MTKHRKILNIISILRNSHPDQEKIFTEGSCIYLFLLLRQIYPEAIAYSNCNHIITKIDDKYYDITGTVTGENYLPLASYYSSRRVNREITQLLKQN